MSQYIVTLLVFVVNNRDQCLIHSYIHNINTRHNYNLHLPLTNLDIYQSGGCCSSIKIFNSLPSNIKKMSDNPMTFKKCSKNLYI